MLALYLEMGHDRFVITLHQHYHYINKSLLLYLMETGIAQSVQRLATGWVVRGSNTTEGEVFLTRLDRPWGPPSLMYNGYGVSFSGERV